MTIIMPARGLSTHLYASMTSTHTQESSIMQHKWAQIDLARQMESIPFIKSFISLLADAGYNGLMLYLEDRIRTKSYPYPPDSECYTESQIRDLVAFAQTRGIELIPALEVLGHAERFLRFPQLQPLAELQGDMKGYFGTNNKSTFCPTNPDFLVFMENYIREVAALFPSPFFHAGLDEFFDFCLCPRCRKVAPDFKGQEALFSKHVKWTRDILASLNKKMIMWSDMFEGYPDALSMLPKDVIMLDWQYQPDVRFYLGHLYDCTVENRFNINKCNGLTTFIGPVDWQLCNINSFLQYASSHDVAGCLVTSWEKKDSFMYRNFPNFVCAGFLMNGKSPEDAFNAMMLQLFGTNDACLAAAIRITANAEYRGLCSIFSDALFLSRSFRGLPYSENAAEQAAFNILAEREHIVKSPLGKLVIRDIMDALRARCLAFNMRIIAHNALDGRAYDKGAFLDCINQLDSMMDTLAERWRELRPGIADNFYETHKQSLLKRLTDIAQSLSGSFCKLRFCLPDGYGVEHQRVSVRSSADATWHQLADAVFKQEDLNVALYERFIPCPITDDIDAIRIEAYGMGGIGVAWAEVNGKTPAAILDVKGFVSTPEHILRNNVNFAWFGSQSTHEDFFNSNRAKIVNSVTLLLQ